ncbi:hypothetical protein ACFWIJ_38620 [Streptomyces sp. NPDC127079]
MPGGASTSTAAASEAADADVGAGAGPLELAGPVPPGLQGGP